MKKILFTGGGTAGHVWPIVSVINALKNKDIEILYVGSKSGVENKITADQRISFKGIMVGKWRSYFTTDSVLLNIVDIFKNAIGLFQSLFILMSFRPDLVFAKGGYVTFPMIFWSRIFRITLVIHESDIIIGKANMWASDIAKKIFVGFPIDEYRNIKKDKLVYTGIPIVNQFNTGLNNKIKKQKPLILVTGGSQGSQKINNLIWEIVSQLVKKYEIYHLVGSDNISKIPKNLLNIDSYNYSGFSSQIYDQMSHADLVISRSGASTLMEISSLEKPSILIPLSTSSANHQLLNAMFFEEKKAAIVLDENKLTADMLLDMINQLIADPKKLEILGHNAKSISQNNADKIIANELLKVLDENK